MKTILHVNNTMNIGGIENYLVNVTKNIDLKQYNFKFLCYKNEHFDFEDILNSYGCKIIRISDPKKVGVLKHLKELKSVMKDEKVDVVESHTYFESGIVLMAAHLAHVKIRIAHSHTTEGLNRVSFFRKVKWSIARCLINIFATERVACSYEAGLALFGNKKFEIIENGIDMNNFYYNQDIRKKLREDLNLTDKNIVLGHVGRFDQSKNHEFLIDLMTELVKTNENYKLMLVGDGVKMSAIKSLVKERKLKNKVIFLGSVNDTYRYYNAFDLFVFPSIYEGLGISLIEAQANGLTCFASSNVPLESKITENVQYLDLTNLDDWVEKISDASKVRNSVDLNKSKYNIKTVVNKLKQIYDKK